MRVATLAVVAVGLAAATAQVRTVESVASDTDYRSPGTTNRELTYFTFACAFRRSAQ
jgi:hypothetical protein